MQWKNSPTLELDDLKKLFDIHYKSDKKVDYSITSLKENEEPIIYNFYQLLKRLARKKEQISYTDPNVDSQKVVVKDIGLNELLGFFTGSQHITYNIRESKITMIFEYGDWNFTSNTGELSIKFMVNKK